MVLLILYLALVTYLRLFHCSSWEVYDQFAKEVRMGQVFFFLEEYDDVDR